jgi:hypothetical protein
MKCRPGPRARAIHTLRLPPPAAPVSIVAGTGSASLIVSPQVSVQTWRKCMRRSIFLLASLSYCLTSYAAGSKKLVEAGAASQPGKPGLGDVVVFQGAHSPGFCIGVAGGSAKPGAYVKQGRCTIANNRTSVPADQFWAVGKKEIKGTRGKGIYPGIYHRIVNAKNPRLCLGVEHGSQALRANIRVDVCNSNPDQKWQFGSGTKSAVMPSREWTARIARVSSYLRASPITPTERTGNSTSERREHLSWTPDGVRCNHLTV